MISGTETGKLYLHASGEDRMFFSTYDLKELGAFEALAVAKSLRHAEKAALTGARAAPAATRRPRRRPRRAQASSRSR